MALIFNNLLINKNSECYTPFLLNLISGRRKLLAAGEFSLVCSMLEKKSSLFFTEKENELFRKLIAEKQFIPDAERVSIEEKMAASGLFLIKEFYSDTYVLSVELTRNCNMSCPYCYVKPRADNAQMTKAHIDAIFDFYSKFSDCQSKVENLSGIRVTGGEPLFSEDSVEMICYVASKWPDTKLQLQTNGVNLLKYFECLPVEHIGGVIVSLDGTQDVHMPRRYSTRIPYAYIYNDIVNGIKKLIENEIHVMISIILDKNNYLEYPKLADFLK